jgi:DNA-binding NarL/FixJ family response regulator
MSVRVLIVDDNPVVRAGLRSLLDLDPDIEVCGEAGCGEEALAVAEATDPDVVLLDVRMPRGGGLDVLPRLCESAEVLMLTYSDEPAVVSEALRTGARGYLVHGAFQSDELSVAIKDTAAGATRLSPAAAAVLVQGLHASFAERPATAASARPADVESADLDPALVRRLGLSARETDICRLMVRGANNGEIARTLVIEEKTVKNHINRIFAKLGVDNRPLAMAVCLGLQEPHPSEAGG